MVSTSARANIVGASGIPTVSGDQSNIPYFIAECQDLGNARRESVRVLSTFLGIQDGE